MRQWLIGILTLLAGIAAATAFAQNAQVTGVVKDQSGAVIPGATVTAKNVDTGLARTAVTDGEGAYRLPSLPPGRYAVTAEISGFSTEMRPHGPLFWVPELVGTATQCPLYLPRYSMTSFGCP